MKKKIPKDNELPDSTYATKKGVCHLGLEVQKIHACPRPKKRVPAKVMWYAPIIPWLKRMFRNKHHAKLMRWHREDRKKDGKLRAPSDMSQWRKIERKYSKDFAGDARNVWFGLSADGINPFGEQSSNHRPGP